MGLFGHEDEKQEDQQPQDQGAAGDSPVPTDTGTTGGADDQQGTVPPVEPPTEESEGDTPVLPSEDDGAGEVPAEGTEEEGDDQTPPAAQ